MSNVLDPNILGLITPWSAAMWRRALDMARADGVPESALIDLVSRGAGPVMVVAFRKAFTPLVESAQRLTEVFNTLPIPPPEPVDVRERALWLRQHRNTGPEHGHPEWRL